MDIAKASVAIPIVGLSATNSDELDEVYNRFGYSGVAGIVTLPLGGTTSLGAWRVHFGGDCWKPGDTTKTFNGSHSSQFIGSVGFGFTY